MLGCRQTFGRSCGLIFFFFFVFCFLVSFLLLQDMDDNKDSYMYAPPGPGLLSDNKPSSLLSSNSHNLLLRGGSNTAKDVLDQASNQDKDDSMNLQEQQDALSKVEDNLNSESNSYSRNGR